MVGNKVLQSIRGKNGGYMLNINLENVSMCDVISWTTKYTKINACLADPKECSRSYTDECKVRKCFGELQTVVEDRLQSIKLNEFI